MHIKEIGRWIQVTDHLSSGFIIFPKQHLSIIYFTSPAFRIFPLFPCFPLLTDKHSQMSVKHTKHIEKNFEYLYFTCFEMNSNLIRRSGTRCKLTCRRGFTLSRWVLSPKVPTSSQKFQKVPKSTQSTNKFPKVPTVPKSTNKFSKVPTSSPKAKRDLMLVSSPGRADRGARRVSGLGAR